VSGLLEKARQGFSLLSQGRKIIAEVTDAVADGKAALSADDQAELNKLLESEAPESREAHRRLDEARTKAANR
jgi:hypothetical protein